MSFKDKKKDRQKIFVMASNLAGRHGASSALEALKNHGAVYGQGVGLQGSSYAIPTKDERIRTMPLERIKPYVDEFIQFAKDHPEMEFNVVKIGTGLARYTNEQMAVLFRDSPDNVYLHPEWNTLLGRTNTKVK
ncbi:MAG TPA: hypothetical protein VN843_11515 [Anaerolineales bacterium]|nr:hypothetical protein [Anaerolineales bacterium]